MVIIGFKAIYVSELGATVALSYGKTCLAKGTRLKMETLAFANLLLDIASIINFIALLWMLRAIVKNRNYLRGFSIVGSFLTFVSILGFEFAYHLLGNVIGFAFGWATVAFWFIAFVYSLKQKLKGTRKQKEMVAV